MVSNKNLVFKKVPTHMPVPGEHLVIEDRPTDIETAPEGGLIVEVLSLSYDPYQRGKLRDASIKSYSPPYPLDQPLANWAIGRVLVSSAEGYAKGDLVRGFFPFAEYATVSKAAMVPVEKVPNTYKLAPELFIGPIGMPGITAYCGLYEIGHPKKGQTIFINSAAGAVSQVVAQLAKREGLRVIGSVGSDEKLKLIKEWGFEDGFNYKTEKPADALKRLVPEGIDIYWENVGGEQFEAALENMNDFGRIICCGMIEGYNKPASERYGVKNLFQFTAKRLTMTGFIQGDKGWADKYKDQHRENVSKWISEGTFKPVLDITNGIDKAAEGFVNLFKGQVTGKAVLKLKD